MKATKKCESTSSITSECRSKQGMIKVISKMLIVKTHERTDLINLSEDICKFVETSGIEDGYVQISSLHTTASLFINEWQDALLSDIKMTLERLVPTITYYKHNDPEYSDCERKNADSHLRNILLGHNLSIPIAQGHLVLGRWQDVIMAEFDGPNQRKLFAQAIGILS